MRNKRVGDLELSGPDEADEHFGLQRFGWGVMAAILVLALAGGFGRGWLARADVASVTGLQVNYERLARADAPTDLQLTAPLPAAGTELELTFPRQYIARMQVMTIVPPPRHARIGPRGITYVFGVSGSGPVTVIVSLKPREAGWVDAAVGLGADAPLAFRQFIFP